MIINNCTDDGDDDVDSHLINNPSSSASRNGRMSRAGARKLPKFARRTSH